MINAAKRLLPPLVCLTLLSAIFPLRQAVTAANSVSTSPEKPVRWEPVNQPAEGSLGNWTLARGSDLHLLTMAADGTLYCYATPDRTANTLFKSADGGRSWTTKGNVGGFIADIAVSPQNTKCVYYTTGAYVYKSNDGGNTFTPLPQPPGAGGTLQVTSLAVISGGNSDLVAISLADSASNRFGGVFLLDTSQPESGWINTHIGNYDVYRVAFSPSYSNDHQLIAVASDEADTIIACRFNADNWGKQTGNCRIAGIVPATAAVAFPDTYNGNQVNSNFYLGIDTGMNKGDVYQITAGAAAGDPSTVTFTVKPFTFLSNIDIAGLACSGNTIIAGAARTHDIFFSNDLGANWTQSIKPPTGQTNTRVIIAPNYGSQHKAYAITCGIESALSYTSDGGMTWNQISLIDTSLDDIIDISAPAPDTCFMLTCSTVNMITSLWRTTDGGLTWDRVFCATANGVNDILQLTAAAPPGSPACVVLLAGHGFGLPAIWKSADNGQSFTVNFAPCDIDTCAVIDSNNWLITGYNGSSGFVYRTTSGGANYLSPVAAGTVPLGSVAVSPDYAADKTIITGSVGGQAYISSDGGTSFTSLGQQLPSAASPGRINLAFDRKFSENKIIYAACDLEVSTGSRDRVFRFIIGKSKAWQSLGITLPDNADITQIALTENNTLYALNTQPVDSAAQKGGVLRLLEPATSGVSDVMLAGLDESVDFNRLAVCGGRLWAVDYLNTQLLTMTDTLEQSVMLTAPGNCAAGLDTTGLTLKWQPLSGAEEYQWQVSENQAFSDVPAGLTGVATAGSAHVTGLSPTAVYYWHVRASKPFTGRWSETWSFNTVVGGSNITPVLNVPAAGGKAQIKPVFQWSPVVSADRYDLQVAKDPEFTNLVIDKTADNAVHSNAWESEIELDYGTTFYWRVKARTESSFGVWSPVGVFITESPPIVQKFSNQPQTVIETTIQPTQPAPILTTIMTMQMTNNPQQVVVNVDIPQWFSIAGIALLGIIAVTLVGIVAITVRRR